MISPNPDSKFGPLLSFADVEYRIMELYRKWMEAWIQGYERRNGLQTLTVIRPRSWITRQTFTALPGQESTPAIIVVSDGFSGATDRHGDGSHDAFFRVGVAVFVSSAEQQLTRALAGQYQAIMLGLALKHRRTADERISLAQFVDLKIDDLDDEAVSRSLAAVRLEFIYKVQGFAEEYNPPGTPVGPPPDTTEPGPTPDDPIVQEVIIETEVMQ